MRTVSVVVFVAAVGLAFWICAIGRRAPVYASDNDNSDPVLQDARATEAVRQIAAILAAAYLRLRSPEGPKGEVDCAKNSCPHVTGS